LKIARRNDRRVTVYQERSAMGLSPRYKELLAMGRWAKIVRFESALTVQTAGRRESWKEEPKPGQRSVFDLAPH